LSAVDVDLVFIVISALFILLQPIGIACIKCLALQPITAVSIRIDSIERVGAEYYKRRPAKAMMPEPVMGERRVKGTNVVGSTGCTIERANAPV
jgi:hypothetical protein